MGIVLNDQQDECVKNAVKWFKKISSKQTFEISGPAGSGKTTIVRTIIQELNINIEDVLFVAYVGKAALQLRRSGVNGKTIHSTFYDIEFVPMLDEFKKPILKENGQIKTKMQFVRKEDIPKNIKLIVVDEGPMVNSKFGADMEHFGVPMIVLGDLQQLPPVIGQTHYLIRPDYILTKIMRQNEGNPIIYLSQMASRGEVIPYGKYGDRCYVIPKKDVTDTMLKNADLVITPKNSTRATLNKYMREEIFGITSELPVIGEKLICRKNNWNRIIDDDFCLVNGMLGFVEYVNKSSFNGQTIELDFRPDFLEDNMFTNIKLDYKNLMRSLQLVNGKVEKGFSMNDMFEFGNCITVHLSQGSQANDVLYYAEPFAGGRELQCKLDYTGITRAAQGLIFAY